MNPHTRRKPVSSWSARSRRYTCIRKFFIC